MRRPIDAAARARHGHAPHGDATIDLRPPPTAATTTLIPTRSRRRGRRLPLAGCPPPPRPPRPPRTAALAPAGARPRGRPAGAAAAAGRARRPIVRPWGARACGCGRYRQTEGGDADAIVRRARAAGLRQLWVRVGDSRDGFYAADVLAELVPRAHRRAGRHRLGVPVPLRPGRRRPRGRAEALAWRGPGGAALDGFSPDIEMATEGVELTERAGPGVPGPGAPGGRRPPARGHRVPAHRPAVAVGTRTRPSPPTSTPSRRWSTGAAPSRGGRRPRPSSGWRRCGPSTSSARATTGPPRAAGRAPRRGRDAYASSTWPAGAARSGRRSGCGSPWDAEQWDAMAAFPW